MQVQAGHPDGEAERRGAGAAAELEHPLAGPGGREGREQHRVGRRAVAAPRLPQMEPAVEEGVAGELGLGEAHRLHRPRSTASSARVGNSLRSADAPRAGTVTR